MDCPLHDCRTQASISLQAEIRRYFLSEQCHNAARPRLSCGRTELDMIDRRTLLALAAGTVAGIGQGFAQSTTLRIGYVPVIGASALFVVAGDGSARDAGLDLKLSKFDSGP